MITTNVNDFVAHVTRIQNALSPTSVGEVVRGKVIRLFKAIVKETPQWSGAAAAMWRIDLNGSVGSPIKSGFHVTEHPYSKGDDPAVSTAFAHNAWVNGADVGFLHGCVISNPQPYIEGLESGHVRLRSLNTPGRMVQRAILANSKSVRLTLEKHALATEKL